MVPKGHKIVSQSPLVSIVIPTFNSESFVERCVQSVLDEPLGSFEVILVDDGSTDSTRDVFKKLSSTSPAVSVIEQDNAGPGVARNRGLEQATGKYVYFLDSDDVLLPGALSAVVSHAEEYDADLVIFSATQGLDPLSSDEALAVIPDGKRFRQPTLQQFHGSGPELLEFLVGAKQWWPNTWLRLFRRSLLTESGIRFAPWFRHEDNPFVVETALAANRALYLPIQVLRRHVRPDSLSRMPVKLEDIELLWSAAQRVVRARGEQVRLTGNQVRAVRRIEKKLVSSMKNSYSRLSPAERRRFQFECHEGVPGKEIKSNQFWVFLRFTWFLLSQHLRNLARGVNIQ